GPEAAASGLLALTNARKTQRAKVSHIGNLRRAPHLPGRPGDRATLSPDEAILNGTWKPPVIKVAN
ncbi:MAG TPA: hypothetical protein VIG52_06735, partial [Methyloceanibacter sp.]